MKKNYYFYKICRTILFPIIKLLFSPQIINKEYIPKEGSYIIAGNHKHALDPILVDLCTKRVVFTLAKKSLHEGKVGFLFRAIGSIPVDTKGGNNKKATSLAVEKLKEGNLINLSPEGTRNKTKELLLPFKYGAVSMANKANCEIIPYSITGDYKLFSNNLKIVFDKPIKVDKNNLDKSNEKLYNNIKRLMLDNMPKEELKKKKISKYRGFTKTKEKTFNYKKNENKVKTNWYKYYENINKHLEYPDISIYEMLETNSKNRLKLTAYNYFGTKATYKELLSKIEICSKSLKKIGVKENEKVTICMPNTPEALTSFYAINKIGAIASMIHPLSAEKEIKYYLNITESKVLIAIDLTWENIKNILKETKVEKVIILSVKESMPLLLKTGYCLTKDKKIEKPKPSKKIIYWEEFIKLGETYNKVTKVNRIGKDEAVILYSGGTSGLPKGIQLSNLNFNALALQSIEACGCLQEKDKVLSIMPIFHGFGLGICIHTVFNFGGTAIILPQFNAQTFHKLMKKYKPNVIAGVPTLYEALINNKEMQKLDLSYLKCVISGGDSLSVNLKRKLDNFLQTHGANIQVREGYGLTECVTGSCLTPENHYREGSIGIPYPDTYYKIVKPNTDEELEYNEEGEIVLSGPSVMLGYLKAKEETKNTLRKHKDGLTWLHTGDLGYMDEEGFVYFKQRLKRMIISSGYNIYPQQIENVIESHPSVLMSCVVGIPHEYKKEVAKAFIVLKDGIKPTEEIKKQIMKHCSKELAKYSLPSEIEFRESLPKTLVGKVAYTQLIKEEQEKQQESDN